MRALAPYFCLFLAALFYGAGVWFFVREKARLSAAALGLGSAALLALYFSIPEPPPECVAQPGQRIVQLHSIATPEGRVMEAGFLMPDNTLCLVATNEFQGYAPGARIWRPFPGKRAFLTP